MKIEFTLAFHGWMLPLAISSAAFVWFIWKNNVTNEKLHGRGYNPLDGLWESGVMMFQVMLVLIGVLLAWLVYFIVLAASH